MFTYFEVLLGVHLTVYHEFNPVLAEWLNSRGVSPDRWIAWSLRDFSDETIERVTDELMASSAADLKVFGIENLVALSEAHGEALIAKRKLVIVSRDGRRVKCAYNDLAARYLKKWFSCSEPYAHA